MGNGDGKFSKLKILELHFLKEFVEWSAFDAQFNSLEKLVLRCCGSLKELPSNCLEKLETLQMIEVFSDCRKVGETD